MNAPQVVSLGKDAVSHNTTERPTAEARMAAAEPAGPPPTTRTSCMASASDGARRA